MNDNAIAAAVVPQALIDSVHNSVLDIFSGYFGPLYSCGDDTVNCAGLEGVMGVISFVGTLPWTLILALPQSTAISMMCQFAGFEIPYTSADMIDAVGELVNILAGAASSEAEAVQIQSRMSLPSVARGSLQMCFPKTTLVHRMHYSSAPGPFRVKIVTVPPQ